MTLEPGAHAVGRTLDELEPRASRCARCAGAACKREARRRRGRRAAGRRRRGAARCSRRARGRRGAACCAARAKKKPARAGFLFWIARCLQRAADHVDVAAGFRVVAATPRVADRRVRAGVCTMARTVPLLGRPSSICVSTAMAILSGRLAEHTIRPKSAPAGAVARRRRGGGAVAGLHADACRRRR